MYKTIIRPFLFLLNPERAHHVTFALFKFFLALPGMKALFRWLFTFDHPSLERTVFGIHFKNPVGLAAGFDKDARMIDEFASLGFGFIEIGTLTPLAQPGNDQPRLFRLPEDQSLINRMGFNNSGAEAAVERLKKRHSNVVVGGNIGKNKVTPNEKAHEDYLKCYHALYDYVDYFVVNVSSPNTPGLRELQDKEPLKKLLKVVQDENRLTVSPKPLLLKIAPDLNRDQLDDIIEIALELELDGLIATNTTISREGLKTSARKIEAIGAGGLSGRILHNRSTEVIAYLCQGLKDRIPVIAVGGIFTASDAIDKLKAGAKLVQVYTGLVYEGPGLVKRINRGLAHEGI